MQLLSNPITRADEEVEKYESVLSLYQVEEELRRLAYNRDDVVDVNEDFEVLDTASYELDHILAQSYDLGLSKAQRSFVKTLLNAIDSAKDLVDKCEGKTRAECITPDNLIQLLKEVDEKAKEIFGNRCTWLRGVLDKYTLSALYNDLAACIHRFADMFTEKLRLAKKRGKCYILRDANPILIAACEAWDKATEILLDEGFYDRSDYESLYGLVKDNKLILRTGAARGHGTHIDLNTGTLEYYDLDEGVNEVLAEILETIGLSCNIRRDGITCNGVNSENLGKVAVAMAFATSMDFRMTSVEEEVKKDIEKLNEILMRVLKR